MKKSVANISPWIWFEHILLHDGFSKGLGTSSENLERLLREYNIVDVVDIHITLGLEHVYRSLDVYSVFAHNISD